MGLSFAVNEKNCRINFQCRRKNVIMVVYGKSGPCPFLFVYRERVGLHEYHYTTLLIQR